MTTILLTGVGGPTPRSIARSLLRYSDLEIEIIGTDITPLAYGLYESDLYSKTYVIPRADECGYWEALDDIVKTHDIDIALIQPEREVLEWTRRKQHGLDWPCNALLPDYEVARLLVDKSLMSGVLRESGLVPASVAIDADNPNYDEIKAKLGYPFWIRATSGSSGLSSLKVHNETTLEHWITINPAVKQFIGSTFLPGRNLACKVLYHKGELLRAASGERVNYIMSRVAPSGITGNTSFGRLLNDPELVEHTQKAMDIIFKRAGVEPHGFFTADYKEDSSGRPFITEINVRMVAFTMSFAAAGANFAEDIVRLLSTESAFDRHYTMYMFRDDLIFLRDVDVEPILMREDRVLTPFKG